MAVISATIAEFIAKREPKYDNEGNRLCPSQRICDVSHDVDPVCLDTPLFTDHKVINSLNPHHADIIFSD